MENWQISNLNDVVKKTYGNQWHSCQMGKLIMISLSGAKGASKQKYGISFAFWHTKLPHITD